MNKAEKLARAMHNVISGGRSFDRQLAAQTRDELRRLDAENQKLLEAALGVEAWWLSWVEQGQPAFTGAPVEIFALRSAIKGKDIA